MRTTALNSQAFIAANCIPATDKGAVLSGIKEEKIKIEGGSYTTLNYKSIQEKLWNNPYNIFFKGEGDGEGIKTTRKTGNM